MGEFYYEPQWLEILQEQEEKLRFDTFSREDALDIGLRIIQLAKEKYNDHAAVCITEDETVIFAYKMPGTDMENDWWMRRKRNVCKATGVNSIRAYVEIETGLREVMWHGRESAFATCGGCMPVLMRQGETFAYIAVSGMKHHIDHQIIADAVADHLNVTIGSIA